jgi:integrase
MNARRRSPKRKNWPANLYQKMDGYFWYRNPQNGKSKGLGRDKLMAFEAADQANAVLASQITHSLADWVRGSGSKSLREFALEYQDRYIKERKPAKNTEAGLRSAIRFICAADFSKKQVGAVMARDVAEYVADAEATRGPHTAKINRFYLHDIFRAAAAEGLIEPGNNPVTVVRIPKADVARDRLSLEQFLKIREHASGWLVNAMNLAVLTGQRREDIANAKFDDFKDGHWLCQQGKTGTKLKIATSLRLDAIGLSVADVVKQCRDNVLSKYLIHHARKLPNVLPGDQVEVARLSRLFAKARDEAKIEPMDGKTPPTFHEIRSLSERLYEKEYGSGFTQKLLGHKSLAMTAKYHDVRGSEWIEVAAG